MNFLVNIDWAATGDYTLAALLGAVVSSGELIARYRDEPWETLRSAPALFYMLVNALASMAALTLVRALGLTFGATGEGVRLIQILVAGFGAMAIFRSSFFTVRVGNEDVAVGAASFLKVVLDAADREVDRRRATLRAKNVKRIMQGISFDKALAALPTYSIALMQNLPPEYQKKLADDVGKLAEFTEIDEAVKAQILGLAVMNYMGEDVLDASIQSLREQIEKSSENGTPAEQPRSAMLDLDKLLERVRSGETEEALSGQPPTSQMAAQKNAALNLDELLERARQQAESGQSQP